MNSDLQSAVVSSVVEGWFHHCEKVWFVALDFYPIICNFARAVISSRRLFLLFSSLYCFLGVSFSFLSLQGCFFLPLLCPSPPQPFSDNGAVYSTFFLDRGKAVYNSARVLEVIVNNYIKVVSRIGMLGRDEEYTALRLVDAY